MPLAHGAYVLTVDGGRMRLLRNRGRDGTTDLEAVVHRDLRNPRTHVLAQSGPGRSFQSMGVARSAYEDSDLHQEREDAFCETALDEAITAAGGSELIVIAPPHVMGMLRKHLARRPTRPRMRQIVKDFSALAPKALNDRVAALL